jgi:hypothetical protein
MVEEDGRYMGDTPAVAGRAAGIDFQSLAPVLMASPEGRKTLAELVTSQKLISAMRKFQIQLIKLTSMSKLQRNQLDL